MEKEPALKIRVSTITLIILMSLYFVHIIVSGDEVYAAINQYPGNIYSDYSYAYWQDDMYGYIYRSGGVASETVTKMTSVSSTVIPNTASKQAIVISADASDPEIYAAQVLQEYLTALDGKECPIISDDQPFEGYKFCIGQTAAYDTSDITGKAADSYVIAPFSNGLAIYGSGSRGTVYGVCTFLEDFCGYRVYTAGSGMVSTTGKMVLPEERIEYDTFFEYRNTDWRSGWIPMYSLVNKLNGDLHGGVTPEQGGNISYLGGSSHTLSTVFCSSDRYYKSHPEYFALHEGKRDPSQLCLTNEEVYDVVLEEVLSLLKDHHDPEADLQIISLSQADNPVYCECEACKALDNENGSHAGSLITFVNRIARAVKEEGYDNVEIDTFAYMHTRKAPSAVVPEDNVIVRLCTFECCFSHPMDDADCSENAKLMKDLEEWSGICKNMYIWDYTTNYAYTLGIFPDFHVLQRNMQCFYEHGIKGVYEEGNYYVHLCDTEFGDLRTYLIAKLLEDPYCDYEAVMLDFCRYYYGEGGEYIKRAIDEITDNTKGHVTIYSPMTESFSIDEEEAEKIDELWDKAENAAKSSDARAAIERSKLSWRYVKAALGLREFRGTLEDNRDEREALYNDLISHGVEMIDEWTSIEQDFAEYEQIPVEEWEYAGRYYYLKYDLNGGTGGPPNQWCNIGESWIPEIIPTREGCRFLGWATKKNATAEYFPGSFITLSSDKILYAVWVELPGTDHSFGNWIITTEATCTEEGLKEKVCDICGYKLTEIISAKGHQWKKVYTIDKKATYAAKGSKSIHCSVCDAIKKGSSVSIKKKTVKTTILSKLTPTKNAVAVKWKKKSGITGYQIQYSPKKNFKGGKKVTIKKASTTSKKIKKLKSKKKYYVRVRTYKIYNGKKYYSKWSDAKTVKIK